MVDSWAWVEILKLSAVGREAKALVEEAEAVFTPSVVLAGLARKYLGEGDDSEIVKGWLQGISKATAVPGPEAQIIERQFSTSPVIRSPKRIAARP